MNTLTDFILGEIDRGSFPSAQYAVAEEGVILEEGAHGWAVLTPERIAATPETIYDLASLTKPLVTALLSVMLNERAALRLSESVAFFLDEFKAAFKPDDKRDITLADLLTHTSGLPPWRPLYCDAVSPGETIAAISRLPLERDSSGGRPVIYSDLNYILAGRIIEVVAGESLDRVASREIFRPAGVTSAMFNPAQELRPRIAATELGRAYERSAVSEMGIDQTVSATPLLGDDVIWGTVHDGNASFLGGVAGHAGLFSTAREIVKLASQF
ncbi:MAG TPA: serine hydrolase, partial [Blastocatellia bacterium]|nr:serine hydrolase [Blastocatellia bacterium]